MSQLVCFAPAKINLTLHVGRPLADRRHPLESVVAFADVGDRLYAEKGQRRFDIAGPFAAGLSADDDNLVLRAAALLGDGAEALRLEKNLPVASGIGGGSADAAAALRALVALRGMNLAASELERLAASLGADVPSCVRSASAFMSGTGEAVAPLPLPELHGVLVNPGIVLSTAAVYGKFDVMGLGGDFVAAGPPAWADADALRRGLMETRNDLEAPARALAPEIGAVLKALAAEPGIWLARMSGSGATCFGLATDASAARAAARSLAATHPAWWVRAARFGDIDTDPRPA